MKTDSKNHSQFKINYSHCVAETMIGFHCHTVHALPLDTLQKIMSAYGRLRQEVKSK